MYFLWLIQLLLPNQINHYYYYIVGRWFACPWKTSTLFLLVVICRLIHILCYCHVVGRFSFGHLTSSTAFAAIRSMSPPYQRSVVNWSLSTVFGLMVNGDWYNFCKLDVISDASHGSCSLTPERYVLWCVSACVRLWFAKSWMNSKAQRWTFMRKADNLHGQLASLSFSVFFIFIGQHW